MLSKAYKIEEMLPMHKQVKLYSMCKQIPLIWQNSASFLLFSLTFDIIKKLFLCFEFVSHDCILCCPVACITEFKENLDIKRGL